jgi:hypothetical protein
MHFFNRNSKILQSRGCVILCFLFCFLLSLPSLVVAEEVKVDDTDTMKELKELKALMIAQSEEWNEMKPALKRLIRSEQDLALIIAALDKTSPLASKPTEKQLLEPSTVTMRVKQKNKESKVVAVKSKAAPINKIMIEKSEKPVLSVNQSKSINSSKVITQIGIHLASYKKVKNVEPGWKVLRNKFSAQFSGKIPFYYQTEVADVLYTRLVVGSFGSTSIAKQACMTLKKQGQYCQVLTYKVAAKKG